jgi:hypothetical protein
LRSFRWRVLLSIANLFLALGMSALGTLQYQRFRGSQPQAFYHGHHEYIPAAQLVSYCMNAPTFLATNALASWQFWRRAWGGTSYFYYVSADFYVLLFFFWWLVGWELDQRPKSISRSSTAALAYDVIGAVFALCIFSAGLFLVIAHKDPTQPGGMSLPVSLIVWGAILAWYFSRQILRLRAY